MKRIANMTANPKETAEDRWEFDQQSEALYQARINKPIDPPFHADSLPTTKANDSHSEPVLISVNQIDEE